MRVCGAMQISSTEGEGEVDDHRFQIRTFIWDSPGLHIRGDRIDTDCDILIAILLHPHTSYKYFPRQYSIRWKNGNDRR